MGIADREGGGYLFTNVEHKVDGVLDELRLGVKLAMIKHAPMHSPHEGHSVIEEEFEELWDHVKADTGRTPAARKEALQLAAMAVRYVIDLIDTPKED